MVYNQLYAGLFSFIILAQLVLYFIFTILKICFLFKSGVMKFLISHVLNLQTVNWKGGWGEKFFLYTVVNWFIRIRSCME